MANYKKKAVTAEVAKETVVETVKEETVKVEEVKEIEEIEEVYVPRKYEQEDLIPCRSMVSGALYIEGSRSHMLYTWADYNDVVDVEYRDLIYMVRSSGDINVYLPRILVEDEELVAQNPKLKEFYDSMYTVADLRNIISLPVNEMKKAIESLPVGCKVALKGLVATMIDEKRLDSVSKIKTLDEIFGTNMILTLVQD